MPKTLIRSDGSPSHGVLNRPGKRPPLRLTEMPAWHGWKLDSESARIIRWIQECLVLPTGHGAGSNFKLAKFQRDLVEEMVDAIALFISIAAGNGKTMLMAALGLERMSRGDDYVEVDILATKEDQAQRLIEACIKLIECSPVLSADGLFDFQAARTTLVYRPTGSIMRAHPAKLSAVQGLDFSLALVDEAGFVPSELVEGLLARLGKRPDARLIGFGTPGTEDSNMLEAVRNGAHAGDLPPGVRFVEYAADAGCDIYDRDQWRKSNPALAGGFLREDALALQAAAMQEHQFRAYHLGQPISSSSPWLPYGQWEECVESLRPRDGTPVVLAVWGNYHRQVSIVGATLDGALFFGWEADKATDRELGDVLRAACEQWDVLELSHKPHIRLNLMAQLSEEGYPVVQWPADTATDIDSTAAFYQAIVEHSLAHDHEPLLTEQVSRLTAQVDKRGNPRLVESEADVSAALAARAAWWRARLLAEAGPSDGLFVF